MASLLMKALCWFQGMSDIDRHQCKRVVPMEVLCLGMSRTGTSSLRQALKDLGYNDTYHASCVYKENPRDSQMWVEAYRAKFHGEGKPYGREDFDKLLGHCMAITDVPCLHFNEELIDAYPNAKVVLSVRDSPEAWLKSMKSTVIPFAKRSYTASLSNMLLKLFAPRLPFQDMNDEMRNAFSETALLETSTEDYTNHNAHIKAMAKEHGMELLEFNVKQGWRPLCKFLNKPIPRDEMGDEKPFPRLFDSAQFNASIGSVGRLIKVLAGVNVILTIAAAIAMFKAVKWASGQSAA